MLKNKWILKGDDDGGMVVLISKSICVDCVWKDSCQKLHKLHEMSDSKRVSSGRPVDIFDVIITMIDLMETVIKLVCITVGIVVQCTMRIVEQGNYIKIEQGKRTGNTKWRIIREW